MDPVNNDVKDAVLGKLFVYFLGVFMPDIFACLFRKWRELFPLKSALTPVMTVTFLATKLAFACNLNVIVTSIFKIICSGGKKHLKVSNLFFKSHIKASV